MLLELARHWQTIIGILSRKEYGHLSNTDFMKSTPKDASLEPRVVKLETGLERLAEDMRDLVKVVRDQGSGVEQEIHKLSVLITQASGPRKTDWQMLISLAFLIIAILGAVIFPLNQTVQENKQDIHTMQSVFREHQLLPMHPVGDVRVSNIDKRYDEIASANRSNIQDLDKKLQRESELLMADIRSQIATVGTRYDKEIQNLGDRLVGRLNAYDQSVLDSNKRDLEELRQWRAKAMGLASPQSEVPLIPKIIQPIPSEKTLGIPVK